MALALIVNTNTWITEHECNAYLEEKLGADSWTALSSTIKMQCIISAYKLMKFRLSISTVTQAVMDCQAEMSWWLYQYRKDYEKRDALIASGVKSFNFNGWSESLDSVKLPQFVYDMLPDSLQSGAKFFTITRELD